MPLSRPQSASSCSFQNRHKQPSDLSGLRLKSRGHAQSLPLLAILAIFARDLFSHRHPAGNTSRKARKGREEEESLFPSPRHPERSAPFPLVSSRAERGCVPRNRGISPAKQAPPVPRVPSGRGDSSTLSVGRPGCELREGAVTVTVSRPASATVPGSVPASVTVTVSVSVPGLGSGGMPGWGADRAGDSPGDGARVDGEVPQVPGGAGGRRRLAAPRMDGREGVEPRTARPVQEGEGVCAFRVAGGGRPTRFPRGWGWYGLPEWRSS